ncbi:MAG: bifunctional 2-polyprenyl-6-hydroxyphenol methylase/3-demethylubiquinol 3-O-methyltransferase UbiG [Gammaproteobacteria bacterium]|nr:bifunctional 2-polyprenyl-6-hydroxyphenol methylase/3-demethylubiquinol 3-O-methyltransferase UbiG [Gammaproteobacteria bacterium]
MSNIDAQEVAKFDAIAAQWWDVNGDFKSLHAINPLRLEFMSKHISLSNKTVLDVGCGGGILSESMAQLGAQVTGLDMSASVLDVGRLHLLESKLEINYQQCTVEDFAHNHPEQFNVVTCMELLEHVPDPESVVRSCAQLLKPKGALFFSTINRNPKAYLQAVVGAEYLLKLLPKGTHDYAKFIRPSELARWARNAGLTVKVMQGMTYNPLTKVYSLCESIDVNYLMYCVKEL